MAILKLKQEDGSWVEVPALIGKNGKTPYIKDGYWWIGETNTNVKAAGTDGKTPYIKESYWWIGNTNTNIKAEGVDGTDGKTAYKYAQDGGYGGTEEQFAEKLANGFGGLHMGSSTPPETADVWVDPNGEPTMVEEWEFDMDDGTVETKSVVVTESEDATSGRKAAILRVRQADGSFAEIPALVGRKGEDGKDGADGKDGTDGTNGKSAYEYAKDGGYTGTEAQFIAELNYLSGLSSNVQTQLNGKAADFTIELYNGNKGNPNPVKFATVDYSTCNSENGVAIKISMVSGHGNGTSYAFLQDAIIRVNYQGAVSVDNFKYYGAAVTDGGVARQYGDIFWVIDTTNKIVDFYCLMGQYARVNMTPYKKLTYSSAKGITQHKSAALYSSGEKVWANNSEIATLNDIPAVPTTTENWTFTLESGETVTKAVYVK